MEMLLVPVVSLALVYDEPVLVARWSIVTPFFFNTVY